jgi:DNA-binding CsgD family transcriptional regulator/PAS domain-containing protein
MRRDAPFRLIERTRDTRLEDMRTLLDLAIERVHAAAIGDVTWREALSALVRVHGASGATLRTPELHERHGGLWIATGIMSDEPIECLVVADGDHRGVPHTIFTLSRPSQAALDEGGRHAVDLTCRHLSLAVRLWFRARLAKHGGDVLAQSLDAAVLLVDGDGEVVWMNRSAARMHGRGRIQLSQGCFVAARDFDLPLARLMRECAEQGGHHIHVSREGDSFLEIVQVSPPDAADGTAHCALIAIRERHGGGEVYASLMRIFQLTPSEVELARALASGVQVSEYAKRRGVSSTTVRTQLRALLAKTRSRRQSDIVALVAGMRPILGRAGASDYSPREGTASDSPSNGG